MDLWINAKTPSRRRIEGPRSAYRPRKSEWFIRISETIQNHWKTTADVADKREISGVGIGIQRGTHRMPMGNTDSLTIRKSEWVIRESEAMQNTGKHRVT